MIGASAACYSTDGTLWRFEGWVDGRIGSAKVKAIFSAKFVQRLTQLKCDTLLDRMLDSRLSPEHGPTFGPGWVIAESAV